MDDVGAGCVATGYLKRQYPDIPIGQAGFIFKIKRCASAGVWQMCTVCYMRVRK